jgi:hypothetical protein
MSDRVAIGYLAQANRHYNFEHFCETMKKVQNREFITTIILLHEPQAVGFFQDVISKTGTDNMLVALVSDVPHNYLNKINYVLQWAIENNYKYTIKLDNDIYFNPAVLDYMYENRHLIADPYTTKTMCLAPNFSTGIPTCDKFMKDFFTPDEQAEMSSMFSKHNFGPLWDGDYSFLKSVVEDGWDAEKYYKALNTSDIVWKGYHPVRINNDIQKRHNEIVMSHAKELFTAQNYYTYKFDFDIYHCNGFFMIPTQIYKTIIDDKSLFADIFEELPQNRFCTRNGWGKVYIGNSFTLHPWYNSYPNHLQEEYQTFQQLMKVKDSMSF